MKDTRDRSEYYKKNKKRIDARNRAWALAHPKEIKRILAKYKALHRVDINKQARERRQLHLELSRKKDRDKARRIRRENPDKYRRTSRINSAKWLAKHPGYGNKYSKEWAKNNPDKRRASKQKRRSRLTGAGGSFTAQEWKALCKKHHNKCLRCKRRRKLTADHVIPVSKGGTSNIDNIQPLCGPCNSSKGAKCTDYR